MLRPRITVSTALAAAVLLGGGTVAASADSAAPVVKNYKFGLVCGASDNRRVCFETNVIQITNESRCVYDRRVIACTWFGFSFDYEALDDVTINCEDVADKPLPSGNPNGVVDASTDRFKYDLTLKKGSHHFFLAKYMSGEQGEGMPSQNQDACSFEGRVLFSTQFKLEFTPGTDPVPSVPDANTSP